MMAVKTVIHTNIRELSLTHRGKVRDVYEIDNERLLLVATDRISAFDCVLPNPIPHKGTILTALSTFWFKHLEHLTEHHLLTSDFDKMPKTIRDYEELRGRSMLTKKTNVFPVEAVVRGYLEGSGWKDYLATGEICGHKLPEGLRQCEKLPEPLFTPATKAAAGHDENITESQFAEIVGAGAAEKIRSLALKIYKEASRHALSRGIIIADTKLEFGQDKDGNIILIDEVLTPDSSRFWSADAYEPGHAQPSFDKQFVREYLESLEWNKQPPAPELPVEIIKATSERYLQAYELLTGLNL